MKEELSDISTKAALQIAVKAINDTAAQMALCQPFLSLVLIYK